MIAFVAAYQSASNFLDTTTTDTASVTVAAGDFLVIGGCSGNSAQIMSTPTGGGLTYTFGNSSGVSISTLNSVDLFSASAPAAQTFTMTRTISPNNTTDWGFTVYRFTGVKQAGANVSNSNSTASAPSGNLTTGVANSAIVMIDTDFNNNAGASTYLTGAGSFSETTHISTGPGAIWAGYYLNAGAAGTYTVGMSAPSNQKWAMVALELQPVPAGTAPQSLIVNRALRRSQNY